MKMYAVALYAVAAVSGFAFASYWTATENADGKKKPKAAKTVKVKNLMREGDIQGTMEAARDLLHDLEAVHWDATQLPFERFRVADQDYAESVINRGANIPTFCAFRLKPELYPEVAFFSSLYTRKNLRVVPGIEAATRPEGFFIVGFKSGEVKQIPIGDVRLSNPDAKGNRWFLFPGQAAYSTNLRKIAGT